MPSDDIPLIQLDNRNELNIIPGNQRNSSHKTQYRGDLYRAGSTTLLRRVGSTTGSEAPRAVRKSTFVPQQSLRGGFVLPAQARFFRCDRHGACRPHMVAARNGASGDRYRAKGVHGESITHRTSSIRSTVWSPRRVVRHHRLTGHNRWPGLRAT